MRIVKANIVSLILASTLLIFTSCKHDTVFGDIEPNTERPIVEFSDPHGFKVVAIDYSNSTIEVDITDIRFMVRTFVKNNATAKISINPGVVYDYNDNNGTDYTVIPASLYGFVEQEFTLTEAERSQKVKIRVKPSDIATGQNAIGISISEVTGGEVSRIAGTLVVPILVKNAYDGIYSISWTNFHPLNNPGYTGTTSEVELHTTGPNSCKMYWPLASIYCLPAVLNGGLASFQFQEPEYTINSTTNAVTVQNVADGATTFYTMNSSFNSRYDPANKTFYTKFGYSYVTPGVFDANCREWTQTFNYLGPR